MPPRYAIMVYMDLEGHYTPEKPFSQKNLILQACILVLGIAVVNQLANFFYWYSTIWWFDMPMHFLGGFFVGLLMVYLYWFSPLHKESGLQKTFSRYTVYILLGVISIGLMWEVFEFVVDMYTTHNGLNVLDTLSDLCFDLAGGSTAFFLLHFHRHK